MFGLDWFWLKVEVLRECQSHPLFLTLSSDFKKESDFAKFSGLQRIHEFGLDNISRLMIIRLEQMSSRKEICAASANIGF